jgi:hypothetical protein
MVSLCSASPVADFKNWGRISEEETSQSLSLTYSFNLTFWLSRFSLFLILTDKNANPTNLLSSLSITFLLFNCIETSPMANSDI